jgi:predicted protein tyrosine phosphatase
MTPRISIFGYDDAENLLGSTVGYRFTHVISINNPDTEPPRSLENHPGKHLIMHFHDISVNPGRGDFTTPGLENVRSIIKFAEDIDENSEVLCHCAAGISRSSASALIIIASKLEVSSINAMKAIQDVLSIKKIIHPNAIMVRLADEELGWDGRLMAAHASTFTGGDLLWMPPELENLEPPE